MESDGRIRSKDIETGGVNSRILNDIRSDNFNGSRDNPEEDPGTEGWQILKNGIAVFNNAVIRGTLTAARIISGVLESGTLNIRSGGSITLGGDEALGVAPTATMSETGMVVGPTSLTASGVTVGPTTLNSSGVTVGTDVVMDAAGLHVDGGDIRAIDVAADSTATNSNTLTTTSTQFAAVTFARPSWAQSAIVHAIAQLQGDNDGKGTLGYLVQARIDDVAFGTAQHDTSGLTINVVHTTFEVITPGATVEVSCYGSRNGGTGNVAGVMAVIEASVTWLR